MVTCPAPGPELQGACAMKPQPHPEEARRQAELASLNILDTPIEERFERITRAARQVLKMPVAAVSLVDEKRQWFKSVQGLEACETARDISFCAHALNAADLFVVPDARLDERFADNPMVEGEPWIRFYAGCPLKGPGGLPMGTLCVADHQPRTFSAKREEQLRGLARAAEAELAARIPSEVQRRLAEECRENNVDALDTLTQVWGRAAILEILNREFARARRKGTGLGAIIVNLDDAAVNEACNLGAGPDIVRRAARRLVRSARAQDAIGRFGGAEFLGVVATQDRAELAAIAQGMRSRIARTPVKSANGKVAVTASLGAAWTPAGTLREPGALLDAATSALCAAQRRGGNRVEVRAV